MSMKFVHISFRFEYIDHVERILDAEGIGDYVCYPMVAGKDIDGKHFGTQVFPGSVTVCQALVEDARIETLLARLQAFRKQKTAHAHMRVAVMSVEYILGSGDGLQEE